MKNIVSLLMAALVATVLAAGCSKMKECTEADGKGETTCQTKTNFDPEKECTWKKGATDKDKDGKCVAATSPAPYDATAEAADKAKCIAILTPADQDACDKGLSAAGKTAGKKCEFTNATTPCAFK
jgi:ABC-type amino acid transport substrate-binding protein